MNVSQFVFISNEQKIKSLIKHVAICKPSCENGGKCIEPNVCSCLPNFGGDYCQLGKCDTVPFIDHSVPDCNSFYCKITCEANYVFPDGSSTIELACKNGKFQPVVPNKPLPTACYRCKIRGFRKKKTKIKNRFFTVDCYPGCQNISKSCNAPPVAQNAVENCDSFQCLITCNKGFLFQDGSSEMLLVCQDGQWMSSKNFAPNCLRRILTGMYEILLTESIFLQPTARQVCCIQTVGRLWSKHAIIRLTLMRLVKLVVYVQMDL